LNTRRHMPAWPMYLLMVVYLWGVTRFWFLCDDAYISFRYARHWARGYGLTFNPGGEAVEGYSNFLWVALCALIEGRLWSVERLVPLVSVVAGIWLVVAIHRVARRRFGLDAESSLCAAAAFAWCPAVAVWSTSGLATMPFTLLMFLCFEQLVWGRRPERLFFVALPLALIRVEGVLWLGVLVALAAAVRVVDDPLAGWKRTLKPWLRPLIGVALVYGVYSVWRVGHFGTWVPNTAHAKVDFGGSSVLRGLQYVSLFGATFLPVLLWGAGLPRLQRAQRAPAWMVGALTVAFPIYAVVVGGDFFPMGRMLIPGLAFGALLFGGLVQALRESHRPWLRRSAPGVVVSLLVLTILPGFDLHVVPHSWREALHFRYSDKEFLSEVARWDNMVDNTAGFKRRGLALARIAHHDDTMVSQAIGAVGFFSGLHIYDQYGLVSREVALNAEAADPLTQSPGHDKYVEASFFLDRNPDILHSRLVQGGLATRLMKDSMDKWSVPEDIQRDYVPDFVEVDLPEETKRSFLLWVRKVQPWEDAHRMWTKFPDRRKDLLAELNGDEEEEP
jgi:arabinofuranosyltransferase